MAGPPLWQWGAAALADGYRRGEVDPVAAARACLHRAQDGQALHNAWVLLDGEAALRDARASAARWARGAPLSPLDGVPVAIKDNLHVRGWPTGWGSRLFDGAAARPADELPVARLRDAGLVLLGKTTVAEFAMQGITANPATGTTCNPWDRRLTPGGSSGGAAAAVAWGAAPLALVTDGGGSARRPASHTGLLGLLPTAGLVPRAGGLPDLFDGHESVGAMAREAQDLALLLPLLAGWPVAPPPQRPLALLWLPRIGAHPLDPAILASTEAALARLAAQGHRIARHDGQGLQALQEVHALWPTLSAAGLAWLAGDPQALAQAGAPRRWDDGLPGPALQAVLAQGRALPPDARAQLRAAVAAARSQATQLLAGHDLLLTPCTAALPWPAAQPFPDRIDGQPAGPRAHAVYATLASAAGLPALAVPSAPAGGLPTGLQLVGRAGDDALLLAVAAQLAPSPGTPRIWPPAG